MKKYLYDFNRPYAVDVDGKLVKISKGETLSTIDGETFKVNGKETIISQEDLQKYFIRIWSQEEQNRFERIWEKSVFVCLKALLEKRVSELDTGTDGILNVTYDTPDMAFAYADMVIERLKVREY